MSVPALDASTVIEPIRQLAAAGGDILTVPDNEYWRLEKISVFNSNASAETIDIYLVASGDTAASTNQIARESVATDATVALDYLTGVVMGPGQSLNMNAVNSDSVVVGGVTRFFQGESRD